MPQKVIMMITSVQMVMMIMRMRTKLPMLNDGVLGQLLLHQEVHNDELMMTKMLLRDEIMMMVMTELLNLVKTPTNSLLITRPFTLRRRRTLKV